jgi:hypothetical protein
LIIITAEEQNSEPINNIKIGALGFGVIYVYGVVLSWQLNPDRCFCNHRGVVFIAFKAIIYSGNDCF